VRQLGAIMLACLFAPPAFADEAPLGRLLLTPEQRAALDIARRNKIRADATHKPKPAPTERDVTVNGVLKRSDGMSAVWLNGRAVEGETDNGMRVYLLAGTPASVVLRTADDRRTLKLKVGQRADLVTGRIAESYEGRSGQAAEEAEQDEIGATDGTGSSGSLRQPRDRREGRGPDSQAAGVSGEPQER